MTEVSKMTDAELNWALGQEMGYTPDKHRPGRFMKNGLSVRIPDYSGCVIASQEVQAVATDKDKAEYIRNLLHGMLGKSVIYYTAVTLETAADIANATPRQRAEAAYMTLKGDG